MPDKSLSQDLNLGFIASKPSILSTVTHHPPKKILQSYPGLITKLNILAVAMAKTLLNKE